MLQRCGVVKLQRYLTKNEYMKEENISAKAGGEYKFTSTSADGETETTHLSMQQLIEILHFEISLHAEYIDPNLKNVIPLHKWELGIESSGDSSANWELGASTTESVSEYYKIHSPSVSKYIQRAFDPAITDEMTQWLVLRDALRDEVNRRRQARDQKPKRKRAIPPEKLPHYTFQEGRNPAMAIADPDGWIDVTGELSLMYAKEDDPIQTKLTAGANLNWGGMPATYSNLRDELRTLGVSGVYCFYVTMGMVLQERHVTLYYDDLMKILGWTTRNAADREEKRRTLYRWHTLFDNLSVHGKRRGGYTDNLTDKTIDTTIQSKLFMISELEYPEQSEQQMRLDGSQAPVSATLTCGPWLERFRGNDKMLEYFGNILKLSGLPTGQAHGEWALSIGMALSQVWRERAYKGAQVNRTGDNNQEVIVYKKPFTRSELLSMFPPTKFKVDEILKSTDPKRAQKYWNDAIDLLKEKSNQTIETKKQISYYKELTGKPLPRQGWQDIWLNQHKFDIRPTGEARADAVEICKAKTKRVAAANRKRKTAKNNKMK